MISNHRRRWRYERCRHPRCAYLAMMLGVTFLACGCGPLAPGAWKESDVLDPVRPLTVAADFRDASQPVLSPDMRWLAFTGVAAGQELPQVFVAEVVFEGDLPRLGRFVAVTPADARSGTPTFSPDGQTLLLSSTTGGASDPFQTDAPEAFRFDAASELYRVDNWQFNVATALESAEPGQVPAVNLARIAFHPAVGYDGEAVISPDGKFVAFSSDRDAPRRALDRRNLLDLYVAPFDGGGEPVRLTTTQGFDGQPIWTIDGDTLVFVSDRGINGIARLYAMDVIRDANGNIVGGGEPRLLTEDRRAAEPSLHPDGEFLVYVDRTDAATTGDTVLRQIRPNGKRDFRLSFDPAADETPRFSQDGKLLLFSSRRTEDGSRQLFVARFKPLRRS
ncbi:MAG: hypothetical protein AAGK78_01190 [Planctomycetota bacterium]